MVALFKIFDPKTLKTRQEYTLDYSDQEELITMFEEARQTWDDCLVFIECDGRHQISQKTYHAEILAELS